MVANGGNLGFKPPHPGEFIREELDEMNMTISQFARHLGVSKQSVSELLNENRSVSVDMAVRLGKAFKNGARFWLTLQMQHDLWDRENSPELYVDPLTWDGSDAA